MLLLLTKHPDRTSELSIDVLMPPAPGDSAGVRLHKLLLAFSTNRLFYTLVKSLARVVWLRGLSRDVMVYLIACQYRRGLRLISEENSS